MRKVKNSIKKMMALCLAAIMTLANGNNCFCRRQNKNRKFDSKRQ